MKAIPCHITIKGLPLCERETIVGSDGICGYPSINSARQSVAKLQKHWAGVRVVRGPCRNE